MGKEAYGSYGESQNRTSWRCDVIEALCLLVGVAVGYFLRWHAVSPKEAMKLPTTVAKTVKGALETKEEAKPVSPIPAPPDLTRLREEAIEQDYEFHQEIKRLSATRSS